MKKLSTFPWMIALIFTFFACSAPAPENITNTFEEMYPNARGVEWELEEEMEWEADFILDGKEWEASFDPEGNWLESEMELKTDELPATLSAKIATYFKGYEILKVEWIETPELKGYEVEIHTDNPLDDTIPVYDPKDVNRILRYDIVKNAPGYELILSEDGSLLGKEAIEEDDDDDDDEKEDDD